MDFYNNHSHNILPKSFPSFALFNSIPLIRAMKKIIPFIIILAVGCTSKKTPDVSSIKINLQVTRFEKEFFAVDTSKIDASLQKLSDKNKGFTQDFLFNILGTQPMVDSAGKDVKAFISSYKSLYESSQKLFADFDGIAKEIEEGLKYTKHYFPAYKLPERVITFIGPINSYANIITSDGLAVGLQLYMGNNYPLYQTEACQNLYPAYVSRRFDKAYIPVNCMKNIVDDVYPNKVAGSPLIEQMIESGKRLYVLDALLPQTEDTLKTGYSKAQLEACFDNEKNIWTFFIENNLLYETEPTRTNMFLNDAPNTPEINAETPGFIGQFVGWQIVKKWMNKNDKKTLAELLQTPNKQIFKEAKYKP